MPLDLNTALNSYGFVGQLANAIPDLRNILNQAISQEWVPAQFERAVMDSGWWKSNAESARQLVRLQATDPATYHQNVSNAHSKIILMGKRMGRNISFANAATIAMQAMAGNWDDEQIRSIVGAAGTVGMNDGAPVGDAAQMQLHLRELTQNYGVSYTQPALDQWTTQIQSGSNSLDGIEALIRARAKAQYAHLAPQIDAGMTVRDIADPYIASYAQTLELPETAITLNDPAIQKALQVKDPTGGFSTKPMHEFVRQLKDDPRWDQTKNAEEEAYRMVNRLGRDMGFLS